jgi:hypothetical protein
VKLIKNRPLIEADDHPLTIILAFREHNWFDSLCDGDKSHLEHRSHNAWETIEDGFAVDRFEGTLYRPDGQALILDFGVDYLEFALVYYGCRLLSEDADGTSSEITQIDQLLRKIDVVKGIRLAINPE